MKLHEWVSSPNVQSFQPSQVSFTHVRFKSLHQMNKQTNQTLKKKIRNKKAQTDSSLQKIHSWAPSVVLEYKKILTSWHFWYVSAYYFLMKIKSHCLSSCPKLIISSSIRRAEALILPLPVLSAVSLLYCEVPESHRIREKKIFMILPY